MREPLQIDISNRGDELAVVCKGQFASTAEAVLAEKLDAVLTDNIRSLTFVMEEITFLSSAGIRVLLKYYKKMTGSGCTFRVDKVSEQVKNVLCMVGLQTLIAQEDTQKPNTAIQSVVRDGITFSYRNIHQEVSSYEWSGDAPSLPDKFCGMEIGRIAVSAAENCTSEFIRIDDRIVFDDFGLCNPEDIPACRALYRATVPGTPSHVYSFETKAGQVLLLEKLIEYILDFSGVSCAGFVVAGEFSRLSGLRSAGISLKKTEPGFVMNNPDSFNGKTMIVFGIAGQSGVLGNSKFLLPIRGVNRLCGHFHAVEVFLPFFHADKPHWDEIKEALEESPKASPVWHLLLGPDVSETPGTCLVNAHVWLYRINGINKSE